MTEPPVIRRIVMIPLPRGDVQYIGNEDPVRTLIADANAELDAARAADERKRKAAIADIERLKNSRKARRVRRLRRALRAFGVTI